MSAHCFFCGNRVGQEGCALCGTVRNTRDERRVRAPCPRCGGEARLVPFGVGDASLQACPRCKGMFVSAVDWDTLLDVFSQEPLPDIVVPDAEELSVYGPYRSAPSSNRFEVDLEPGVRCPTCHDEMERTEFAAMTRVIIDICPAHGVWLDAGELERVIDSVHPHPQMPPKPLHRSSQQPVPPLPAPTLVEAAREPMTPIAPDDDWKRTTIPAPPPRPAPPRSPSPPSDAREEPTPPWTLQLRRALGRLVSMIVSRK